MNEMDHYKAMFSKVHADVSIQTEELKMTTINRTKRQVLRTAIILCILLVALSATAYAINLFSVKDLVLDEPPQIPMQTGMDIGENGIDYGPDPDTLPPQPMDHISLQGYAGSNEYLASNEWHAFTSTYDVDGAMLAAIGNNPTGFEERYGLYLVYTQEMADKLEEIVARYGLELHSGITADLTGEQLVAAVASGNFLGENAVYSNYMYEDGTFQFDSIIGPADDDMILYQFICYKKGSFTDAILNIGNADDYITQPYQSACGAVVNLLGSPGKSLIVLETETSFITINIMAGNNDGFGMTELEAFADSFDFTLLN